MVDKEVADVIADLERFVDVNMKAMGGDYDYRTGILMMSGGIMKRAERDGSDYFRGISAGLMIAHLIIEYCEKKVN